MNCESAALGPSHGPFGGYTLHIFAEVQYVVETSPIDILSLLKSPNVKSPVDPVVQ